MPGNEPFSVRELSLIVDRLALCADVGSRQLMVFYALQVAEDPAASNEERALAEKILDTVQANPDLFYNPGNGAIGKPGIGVAGLLGGSPRVSVDQQKNFLKELLKKELVFDENFLKSAMSEKNAPRFIAQVSKGRSRLWQEKDGSWYLVLEKDRGKAYGVFRHYRKHVFLAVTQDPIKVDEIADGMSSSRSVLPEIVRGLFYNPISEDFAEDADIGIFRVYYQENGLPNFIGVRRDSLDVLFSERGTEETVGIKEEPVQAEQPPIPKEPLISDQEKAALLKRLHAIQSSGKFDARKVREGLAAKGEADLNKLSPALMKVWREGRNYYYVGRSFDGFEILRSTTEGMSVAFLGTSHPLRENLFRTFFGKLSDRPSVLEAPNLHYEAVRPLPGAPYSYVRYPEVGLVGLAMATDQSGRTVPIMAHEEEAELIFSWSRQEERLSAEGKTGNAAIVRMEMLKSVFVYLEVQNSIPYRLEDVKASFDYIFNPEKIRELGIRWQDSKSGRYLVFYNEFKDPKVPDMISVHRLQDGKHAMALVPFRTLKGTRLLQWIKRENISIPPDPGVFDLDFYDVIHPEGERYAPLHHPQMDAVGMHLERVAGSEILRPAVVYYPSQKALNFLRQVEVVSPEKISGTISSPPKLFVKPLDEREQLFEFMVEKSRLEKFDLKVATAGLGKLEVVSYTQDSANTRDSMTRLAAWRAGKKEVFLVTQFGGKAFWIIRLKDGKLSGAVVAADTPEARALRSAVAFYHSSIPSVLKTLERQKKFYPVRHEKDWFYGIVEHPTLGLIGVAQAGGPRGTIPVLITFPDAETALMAGRYTLEKETSPVEALARVLENNGGVLQAKRLREGNFLPEGEMFLGDQILVVLQAQRGSLSQEAQALLLKLENASQRLQAEGEIIPGPFLLDYALRLQGRLNGAPKGEDAAETIYRELKSEARAKAKLPDVVRDSIKAVYEVRREKEKEEKKLEREK